MRFIRRCPDGKLLFSFNAVLSILEQSPQLSIHHLTLLGFRSTVVARLAPQLKGELTVAVVELSSSSSSSSSLSLSHLCSFHVFWVGIDSCVCVRVCVSVCRSFDDRGRRGLGAQ